ncbi:hypothetical protein B0J11DRAFT_498565 [Dendryphion nanum]|uniref:15-hydroxyprostaglandin dehydrogenase n=1 Tax=Dendryphion nanum TaxID=256645 RepID=A0A9P9I8I7_9PLEO|nr:hypothetical protein B0J11DRAFT_598350 [Dendryphion nanum]KAH7111857.1 hypothetical protein B0J11DRAFT_498565 [Dendryphion nanum]
MFSTEGEQKVAIVTGAARGIGSWLAKNLHDRGYRVALCDCHDEHGQAMANSLDDSQESAIFVHCDVKSYQSQQELFQAVWKKWFRLDVLIANAGCVDRGSVYNLGRRSIAIGDLPPEPDTSCTDTVFKGLIYGTVLATHFMRHSPAGSGKIIATGSMIGVYPCATFPEYCSAKAAIHQWVKTTGFLLQKKENITINCIMPGPVNTTAMPDFSEAFLPEHLTLKSNLIAGYDIFLDDADNKRTGETLEAAHDEIISWGHPEYKSGEIARRYEKVYEPWFQMLHGEKSGVPGAIENPPGREVEATGVASVGKGIVSDGKTKKAA